MSVLRSSSDFQAELFDQRDTAVALFGQDPEASSLAGASRPFTPPEYADLLSHDWGQTYYPLVETEIDSVDTLFGGLSGETIIMIRQAKAQLRTLNESELARIAADEPLPLTASMTRALNRAFQAVNGPTRVNSAGVPCLTGAGCATFWDQMATFGINAGAVRASVTSGERWRVFRDAIPQGLENVADQIGAAAAKALREAGRSVGAGAHGFFEELGVVDSAILVGGGLLLFRVL